MSQKSELAVVLVVALFVGTSLDRLTALKMAAGMTLLWLLQNQSVVFEGIRKLLSHLWETSPVREYRGDLRKNRTAA